MAADLEGRQTVHGQLKAPGGTRRRLRCRRRTGRGRRRRVGDRRDEVAVARREVRRVQAPEDIGVADRHDPGLVAAGRVGARLGAGLDLANIAVVAGGETRHELLELVRLRGDEPLHHRVVEHVPVIEVGIEVARLADGALEGDGRVGAEVAGALAAEGQHRVGDRAQVVLGLRITVAVAGTSPVRRLDVRHPHRGAADFRAVGGGGLAAVVAVAVAAGQQRGHSQGQREQRPPAASNGNSHVLSPLCLSRPGRAGAPQG